MGKYRNTRNSKSSDTLWFRGGDQSPQCIVAKLKTVKNVKEAFAEDWKSGPPQNIPPKGPPLLGRKASRGLPRPSAFHPFTSREIQAAPRNGLHCSRPDVASESLLTEPQAHKGKRGVTIRASSMTDQTCKC